MTKFSFMVLAVTLVCLSACNGPAEKSGEQVLSTLQMQKQVQDALAFQQEMNREFRIAETSPLTGEDREHFTALDFYSINRELIFKLKLKRTPQATPFMMQRTKDEIKYIKYGKVSFAFNGKNHNLSLYQNLDLIDSDPEYSNHLFLPFTDLTNGEETYGGGRYLDLEIPDGPEIVINFNKAYNPYCAYNKKYSCPIPPKENHLNMRVEAGVRKFKQH